LSFIWPATAIQTLSLHLSNMSSRLTKGSDVPPFLAAGDGLIQSVSLSFGSSRIQNCTTCSDRWTYACLHSKRLEDVSIPSNPRSFLSLASLTLQNPKIDRSSLPSPHVDSVRLHRPSLLNRCHSHVDRNAPPRHSTPSRRLLIPLPQHDHPSTLVPPRHPRPQGFADWSLAGCCRLGDGLGPRG
jgi:hypothetical protein